MLSYKFGIDELMTKINILKEEFSHTHEYSPIEHVSSRLKSPESILEKAARKGIPLSFDAIRREVSDIAGVRVTCSFITDTYRVCDLLSGQQDVTVLEVKDYIAEPKPNGYKSLHMIVQVPVFLSDRVEQVKVEVQIRTIAMDFWASLEHKIYYKYDRAVPVDLLTELKLAADVASTLDRSMERLHDEVRALPDEPGDERLPQKSLRLPENLLLNFGPGIPVAPEVQVAPEPPLAPKIPRSA
ncbi:MAG: GTP pyrophosphokinase family protein [Microbacteriaceae bacterium]